MGSRFFFLQKEREGVPLGCSQWVCVTSAPAETKPITASKRGASPLRRVQRVAPWMSSLRRSSRATASVSPPFYKGRRRGSAISRCTSPSDLGVEIKAWQERRLRTFDGVTTIEDIHVCPSQEGLVWSAVDFENSHHVREHANVGECKKVDPCLVLSLFWGGEDMSHTTLRKRCRKEIATWLILPVAYACLKD